VGDRRGWAASVALQAEVQLAGAARRPSRRTVLAACEAARRAGDRSLELRLLAVAARLAPQSASVPVPRRPVSGDVAAELAVAVARIDRAARAGRDARVLRLLRELLALRRQLASRATTAQTPDGSSVGFVDGATIALRYGLERRDPALLARLTRLVRALASAPPATLPGVRAFAADAVEADFVAAGVDVWRVVTSNGRAQARRVADRDTVVRLGRLARAERALAQRPGRLPAPADDSLQQLDALLFPDDWRPERLRISYPSALAAIPWAALPTLATTEWAVSAASATELERGRPPRTAGLSVIVGPDVPNGADEAEAVRGCYPDGRLLDGGDATIAGACQRLSDPGVVHVAAHAGRRGDDPTLSWIDLADGRLTCRDLRRTAIRADCVVLAACDAATPAGDLAAGVVTPATTMLAVGAAAVIAPTEPVEHQATTAFLTTVHRGLAGDLEPARALALAREQHAGTSAAGSFVCLVASV
jgi:hypothetical protein